MTTFKRNIVQLDWGNIDGIAGAIRVVHWDVTGEDENGTTGRVYGAEALDAPDPDSFTDKSELTPEIVMGWLGEEHWTEAEAKVQAVIDKKNDTSEGKGLPWAS